MEAVIGQTGRTARLVEDGGVLVAAGDTPADDDILLALIDTGRKRWLPGLKWSASPHATDAPG